MQKKNRKENSEKRNETKENETKWKVRKPVGDTNEILFILIWLDYIPLLSQRTWTPVY